MPEETAVAEPQTESACTPKPIVHLVARNPVEMASAQAHLASWLAIKVGLCQTEAAELSGAVAEAKQHKWKSSILEGQHTRAVERHRFYEKCLLAVEAGYTIIPDIPIDVFAIRTARAKPRPGEKVTESTNQWVRPNLPDETPQRLPAGEGEYRNPAQLVQVLHERDKNNEGEELHIRSIKATGWNAIEFPVIAAVPLVMSATEQAMAAKLFDQIGVSPQGRARNADPLIIGQILGQARGWNYGAGQARYRTASFLIAWHLDVRTL